MPSRPMLTIKILAGSGTSWPVEAHFVADDRLPVVSRDEMTLDTAALLAAMNPEEYGERLGRAVFHGAIRDAFMRALGAAYPGPLHVLIALDPHELRPLHWEQLCAPIDDRFECLGKNKRVAYARFITSGVDRRFRPLRRDDLRALVVVADPEGLARYGLESFDGDATADAVGQALEGIPHDVLGAGPRSIGLPTLDALCAALSRGNYPVVHLVAHGRYRRDGAEMVLFLSDDAGYTQPVSQSRIVARLRALDVSLPHFIYLASCESAAERSDATSGSLAQQLVGELGIPAVVAMTRQVSVDTASALATAFYRQIRVHGHIDQAMVEATSELADRFDILVPALYTRLGNRPLFTDPSHDQPVTESSVEHTPAPASGPRPGPPTRARPWRPIAGVVGTAVTASLGTSLWLGTGALESTEPLVLDASETDEILAADLASYARPQVLIPFVAAHTGAQPPAPTEDPAVGEPGKPQKHRSPRFEIGARSGCDARPFLPLIPRLNACYTGKHDSTHWQLHTGGGRRYEIFARFHVDPDSMRLTDVEITTTAVHDRAPYSCIRKLFEAVVVGAKECVGGSNSHSVLFENSLSLQSHRIPQTPAPEPVWH